MQYMRDSVRPVAVNLIVLLYPHVRRDCAGVRVLYGWARVYLYRPGANQAPHPAACGTAVSLGMHGGQMSS